MLSYGTTLGFSAIHKSQCALFIGGNKIVNAVFKVTLKYVADLFIGRFNTLIICCIFSTPTIFALPKISTGSRFMTFVFIYGINSEPIISLLPTSMVEIFGIKVYQFVTVFFFLSRGVGTALGLPIADFLFNKHDGNYICVIIYTETALIASSLCAVLLRVLVSGKSLNWYFLFFI